MDITEVEILHDHVVRLRFADGIEKTVDLNPYLHGPVFEAIRKDPAVFATVKVDPDAGTIFWPNGADLAGVSPLVSDGRVGLAEGFFEIGL
jgi:hypothetical protein